MYLRSNERPGSCRPGIRSGNGFDSGQHLVGFGANTNVFRKVFPTHHTRGIHQKLRGPGDVTSSRTTAHVQQIIAADHFRFGIGEEGETVSSFAAKVRRNLRGIDADGDRTNAGIMEFAEIVLYAS
jgi:hypothetical protein